MLRLTTIILASLILSVSAWGNAAAAGAGGGIRVSVSLNAEEGKARVMEDPLLLTVVVSNAEASNIWMLNKKNEELAEAFKKSDAYSKLSDKEKAESLKEYAPMETPVYTLGSKDRALSELIGFDVTDGEGKNVALKVRRLASTSKAREALKLSGADAQFLEFGIDPSEFGRLKDGKYTLRAFIDTTKEKGMWNAMAASEPVAFTLVKSADAPDAESEDERLKHTGLFYLLDEEFLKAKDVAQKRINMDKAAIGGWVLLGEAEDGLGRHREAYDAFRAALDRYNEKKAKGEEAEDLVPTYVILRLEELEKKLGIRN
jgi:tetratricopeptide (TPR) repeat protein